MKPVITILLILILLISVGCSNKVSEVQIANPSATKCIEDGYRYEIRTNNDGSQTGYCISNNNECDGWAYFNQECYLE
jgi:uncharacterized protein